MNKKQKKVLIRIIVAAVLMIALSVIPVVPSKGVIRFVLFMIPYLVIGYDILRKAFKGILNRQVFDENFLMAVATDRKSTRLNSSHPLSSRMPSSA